MDYQRLKREEYHFVLYENLKCQFILRKEEPFKVIRIENGETVKLIILKLSKRGIVTTRTVTVGYYESVFLLQWLSNDFPDIEVENVAKGGDDGNDEEQEADFR